MKDRKGDIEMSRPQQQQQQQQSPAAAIHPEDEFTEYQPFNWKRFFLTPKYIPIHITVVLVIIATIVITLYHSQLVTALTPISTKVRDLPAGWVIPVVILIIISFPPLFGHELVGLLVGVIYGLWVGFAIVAAGTFFGELGTWFAFKKLFRQKAIKMERTNLNYGAMARLTRDGGFWIVLIIRFSVIPSHMSTAIFSTCDVNFWFFALATFLTLPKQLIIVYLGVLLVAAQDDSKVKTPVIVATGALTFLVGFWIYWKMAGIKKILLQEQEDRRAAYEQRLSAGSGASGAESGSDSLTTGGGLYSSSQIPLDHEQSATGAPKMKPFVWQQEQERQQQQQQQQQDTAYQPQTTYATPQRRANGGYEQGYTSPAGYNPPAEQSQNDGDIGYAYTGERRYDPTPAPPPIQRDDGVEHRGFGLRTRGNHDNLSRTTTSDGLAMEPYDMTRH